MGTCRYIKNSLSALNGRRKKHKYVLEREMQGHSRKNSHKKKLRSLKNVLNVLNNWVLTRSEKPPSEIQIFFLENNPLI